MAKSVSGDASIRNERTYTLTESRLVDLDSLDTSLLKIDDLVAKRESEQQERRSGESSVPSLKLSLSISGLAIPQRLILPRHLRSSPRSPSLLVALHRSRRVPASHAPATHPRRAGRGPSASAMPSTTSPRCVYSSPSCLLIPTLSPARARAHEEETVKGCKRCILLLPTRSVACLFLLSSRVKHSRP